MKAKELLEVNFSGYKRISINRVIIRDIKIVAEEDHRGDISLLGFIGRDLIFTTYFEKDEEIKIKELEDDYLFISRK